MRPKARIELFENRVEKRQSRNLTEHELLSTQTAQSISEKCGYFRVPSVLACDASTGVIVFERLRGVDSLRKLLPLSVDPGSLVQRVALSLASIHNLGKLKDSSCSVDFAHGDFSIDNVFVDTENDQLYIIDWSVPVWRNEGAYSDRYHDLSIFVMSLFARPVFYPRKIPRVHDLATVFFDTYRNNSAFDPGQLQATLAGLFDEFLPFNYRLSRWRAIANYPSVLRCRRFVARLARSDAG